MEMDKKSRGKKEEKVKAHLLVLLHVSFFGKECIKIKYCELKKSFFLRPILKQVVIYKAKYSLNNSNTYFSQNVSNYSNKGNYE